MKLSFNFFLVTFNHISILVTDSLDFRLFAIRLEVEVEEEEEDEQILGYHEATNKLWIAARCRNQK